MIAGHHGQHNSLRELRAKFPLSLRGCTLSQLVDLARQMGLQSRPLRLELGAISQLKLPCVLHWDMSHFVVLTKVGRGGITLVDPGFGFRRMSLTEASDHFTGVALELAPGPSFSAKRRGGGVSLRALAGRVHGLGSMLALILGLSLGLQVCIALTPFLMQLVVDQVLVAADTHLLTVVCIGFLLLLLIQIGIWWLRGSTVIYLASHVGVQWAGNVFAHLLRLPLDFFEKRNLGDVVSRLGAVQAIQRTLTSSFIEVVIDGLMAVVTFGMMLLYSKELAFLTLLAVMVYLVLRAVAFESIRSNTEKQLVAAAAQQSYLLETIRGVQSLKLANGESVRESGYLNHLSETANKDVWLARFNLGFNSISQLVFGVERILVVWIGARLALDSVFSVGMLIAYLAYKEQFSQRAGGLIDKIVELRMLRLHGERLSDIALAEPEEEDPVSDRRCEFARPGIVVEGLSFRYSEHEPWILRDCSFRIEPGESVAIVGASGCGKTTLLKLLLGLLPANSGVIRIGGVEMSDLGRRRYRAMTGAVMQDDQLFAGSIADNIALGYRDYDQAAIEVAARMAAIHDDVVRMPMGYHSLIGDMGAALSGGQKQRVLLARALYRNPQLLFLDEATSHLDVACEQRVSSAVRNLDLTRVIIAHRPETISSADRVLTLRGGQVSEAPPPPDAEVVA